MTKGIHLLSGHTLLCGYGRVGKQLAKELRAFGQKFVIIDSGIEALREAEAEGYWVLVGDCTQEAVSSEPESRGLGPWPACSPTTRSMCFSRSRPEN